jgi:hypothetical protein
MHRRGELADAEARARWALERATGINAIQAVSQLVEALVDRDALGEAEQQLGRLSDPLASHSILATNNLLARGRLRAAQGRTEEAGNRGGPRRFLRRSGQKMRRPCPMRRHPRALKLGRTDQRRGGIAR